MLTTGGIAAPQIMYAREASNFHELAAQVNEEAETAASLSQRAASEELLLELRSAEAVGMPAKLAGFAKNTTGALSADFKREIGEAAAAMTAALAVEAVPQANSEIAKKALSAREAELPDPRSWFDVDPDLLAFYADITPEGVVGVDTQGTVTFDRVQEAKRLHETNAKLATAARETVKQFAAENAALAAAVETSDELLTAESQRISAAALAMLAERKQAAELAGLDPEADVPPETVKLAAAASELQKRSSAVMFVVTDAGVVEGLPAGAESPQGAVRIPGGPAVRMRYIGPAFREFLGAYAAETKALTAAAEAAEAAELEAAANAAAQGGGFPSGDPFVPQTETPVAPAPPVTTPPTAPVTPPDPIPGTGGGEDAGGGTGGEGGG